MALQYLQFQDLYNFINFCTDSPILTKYIPGAKPETSNLTLTKPRETPKPPLKKEANTGGAIVCFVSPLLQGGLRGFLLYIFTNFPILSPILTKYIPGAKPETSILTFSPPFQGGVSRSDGVVWISPSTLYILTSFCKGEGPFAPTEI
jgi:hypothetical protein